MNLKPGPVWESFEHLRTKYAENLKAIQPGEVGTLYVKREVYRVMTDADFLALEAQTQLAVRLIETAEDVRLALGALEQSPTDATRTLLSRLVDRLVALKENA